MMSLSKSVSARCKLSESRCQRGIWGDEAETQKVMSQKCIENMYFRTIFLRHKKRWFTGVAWLSHNFQFSRQSIHGSWLQISVLPSGPHSCNWGLPIFCDVLTSTFDNLQRADTDFGKWHLLFMSNKRRFNEQPQKPPFFDSKRQGKNVNIAVNLSKQVKRSWIKRLATLGSRPMISI